MSAGLDKILNVCYSGESTWKSNKLFNFFPQFPSAVAAHILTLFNHRGVATAAPGRQERVEELGFAG